MELAERALAADDSDISAMMSLGFHVMQDVDNFDREEDDCDECITGKD
jgi:hypothetical protein